MYIKVLLMKKACNIVLQSSKREDYKTNVFAKNMFSEVGGWGKRYKRGMATEGSNHLHTMKVKIKMFCSTM